MIRTRLAVEAAGMSTTIGDGAFDFAQDDGAGMLGAIILVVGGRDANQG